MSSNSKTLGQLLTPEGNLVINGTITATGYNSSNWDAAYSWGNHATQGYLTSIPSEYLTQTEGDTRYVLGSGGYNNSNWDTAYSWGDHSAQGYLTSETHVDSISFSTSTGILTLGRNNLADLTVDLDGRYLTSYTDTNTTYGISAQDVSGGKAIRLTGSDGSTDDVTFAAGSNVTLTRSGDTITIASTDTNTDTNTTDWYVANSAGTNQFKVDKNEKVRFEGSGATSVSFDAATNKITIGSTDTNTETTTTLTKVGNELRYVNEAGTTQAIDLSLYLDDTNLARILSGTMNSSGIATFTRDDGTNFTVDMSVLLDDTNLSRIVSASWNTSNGVLTLTRNDSSTVTVDLDGRYYNTGESDGRYVRKTGDTMTGVLTFNRGTTRQIINLNATTGAHSLGWESYHNTYGPDTWNSGFIAHKFYSNANTLTATIGTGGASGSTVSTFYGRTDFPAGLTSQTLDIGYTGDRTIQALSTDKSFGTYGDLHLQHYGGDLHAVHGGGIMYDNGSRVFSDRYHPNADKWTTARTHTVTLTGDVSGTASQSVDGTGNKSWVLNTAVADDSHFHHRLDSTDDRDVKPNTSGIGSGVQAIKPFFTSLGGMTGSANGDWQDLLVLDTYSDTSGGNANAITMDKSDGSMRIWNAGQNATSWGTGQRVFADNYHPNADKWTTARTHTVTLTGEVTGTATQTVDGTGNRTWSIATTLNDNALNDHYVQQLGITGSPNYTTPSSRRVEPNTTNPTNEHYAISTFGNDGNVTGQLATHFVSGQAYTRGHNNGWSSWRKIWDSQNFDPATYDNNRFVRKTGDTMTGNLTMGPGTKIHLDSVGQEITFGQTPGQVGYIRQDVAGQIQIGSDNEIAFYETDANTQSVLIETNTGNINANGTITAASFVGSINYNQITNPPVIDNSVDYINAASFNTSTGVLTLSGVGRAGATVDLDNRYLTSYSETDTLQSVTNRGNTTTQTMIIRESSAGGFEFRTADSWGGWARHTHSISTGGGTHLYGFGGYGGSGTTLSYAYLGKDYQDMNIRMYPDGETQLFYNNSRKLATIAKGVKVGITNAVIGSSVITGDMDTVLEIGVPDGSSASQASNYPSTSGVVFHHGGASTAALKYIQSDANTGIFRFVSDRTNTRIEINNGNTRLHQGSGNSLEVTTNSGWLQLGPQNTGFCHLQSNRDFYFNRRVVVDSGLVESYNEDLYLRRANNSSHQIRIAAGTTTISQNTVIEGNLTVSGSISQADGFGTLYTFNTTQGLSTSWADVTAIAGGAIPTGTYAIQIKLYNHDASPSGGNYDEHYSGTMSWFAGGTNDNDWNEIPLHNAGHAYNGPAVYARTLRRPSGQGGLILQLAASGTVGSDEIQIKLRRLI